MRDFYCDSTVKLPIDLFDDVHNEYAVLDKAGRVQIPKELLEEMGVKDNKVLLEMVDGKIVISKP